MMEQSIRIVCTETKESGISGKLGPRQDEDERKASSEGPKSLGKVKYVSSVSLGHSKMTENILFSKMVKNASLLSRGSFLPDDQLIDK